MASLGHQELTLWGDRCQSLGLPTAGPLSRIIDEGIVGASIRPAGTHSDPTMGALIRDERVYNTDRAVQDLRGVDDDAIGVVEAHYIRGENVPLNRLWSAQTWVGSWLQEHDKIPDVGAEERTHTMC